MRDMIGCDIQKECFRDRFDRITIEERINLGNESFPLVSSDDSLNLQSIFTLKNQ